MQNCLCSISLVNLHKEPGKAQIHLFQICLSDQRQDEEGQNIQINTHFFIKAWIQLSSNRKINFNVVIFQFHFLLLLIFCNFFALQLFSTMHWRLHTCRIMKIAFLPSDKVLYYAYEQRNAAWVCIIVGG